MMDNIISTSFLLGIACYASVDSILTRNTLATLLDPKWRTSMNIAGSGNNIIANNMIGPRLPDGVAAVARSAFTLANDGASLSRAPLPGTSPADLAHGSASGLVHSGFSAEAMLNGDPEPAVWAQLFFGFWLIGLLARRRTGSRA